MMGRPSLSKPVRRLYHVVSVREHAQARVERGTHFASLTFYLDLAWRTVTSDE